MSARQIHDNLTADGRIANKSCIVTTATEVSVTIARPDITTELHKRDLTMPYVQHIQSGKNFPILKLILGGAY
jgi:hypothetical protein